MKVKFLGKSDPFYFIHGKVYECLEKEEKVPGLYRIVDETGEDYLYFLDSFEIVEISLEEFRKIVLSELHRFRPKRSQQELQQAVETWIELLKLGYKHPDGYKSGIDWTVEQIGLTLEK